MSLCSSACVMVDARPYFVCVCLCVCVYVCVCVCVCHVCLCAHTLCRQNSSS